MFSLSVQEMFTEQRLHTKSCEKQETNREDLWSGGKVQNYDLHPRPWLNSSFAASNCMTSGSISLPWASLSSVTSPPHCRGDVR